MQKLEKIRYIKILCGRRGEVSANSLNSGVLLTKYTITKYSDICWVNNRIKDIMAHIIVTDVSAVVSIRKSVREIRVQIQPLGYKEQ